MLWCTTRIKNAKLSQGSIGMTWKQDRDRTTIYMVIESRAKYIPIHIRLGHWMHKQRCRDVLCKWFNYHVYCSTIPILFPFFFARHPYIYFTFSMFFILVSVLFWVRTFHVLILTLHVCCEYVSFLFNWYSTSVLCVWSSIHMWTIVVLGFSIVV